MRRVLIGDVREQLTLLPDESVHCIVTSPPYWNLRDYQHPGQIGLEPTPEAYVESLVAVFREARRVLRHDGTLWLNLGDSYASQGGSHAGRVDGLKPKDLVGIPWMVAFALRADGWFLRADNIWAKACSGQRDYLTQVALAAHRVGISHEQIAQLLGELDLPVGTTMPESVKDRTTKSHEYVFMLTKSDRYFYDGEAVKESAPKVTRSKQQGTGNVPPSARNLRSVWAINPQPFKGAHFATFPKALARTCIEAGTPEVGVCPTCGAPPRRIIAKGDPLHAQRTASGADANGEYLGTAQKDYAPTKAQDPSATKARILAGMVEKRTVAWYPPCVCAASLPPHPGPQPDDDSPDLPAWWEAVAAVQSYVSGMGLRPATVLDLFAGSGTAVAVADDLGRDGLGIELNPDYAALLETR